MPIPRRGIPGLELGKPEEKREDTPQSALGRLIESGTGLLIPPAEPSDPLTAFEARHVSWHAAEPHILKLEAIEAIKEDDEKASINWDLLRFAILRLADLALIAYRGGRKTPVRLSTIARLLNSPPSPSDEFTLLHLFPDRARGFRDSRAKVSGHPSYAKVLSVLSGLAWHLKYETNRPHFKLLVDLVKSVYPPIFILRGSRRKDQSNAWRQLSEAISKYKRNKGGEEDYKALCTAMSKALQALNPPFSR